MTSFTTTTRILQGFAFLCKLMLLLFKPHWNYKRFKYEGKNEKDSGRSSKMTPSCKWPIRESYANLRREMNKNMNEPEQELSEFSQPLWCLCTYQWFAPGLELDSVKHNWVGNLTSWTSPGWETWLSHHLGKWRTREWLVRGLPS